MWVYVCVCVCVCMWVCMWVCMCVCVYNSVSSVRQAVTELNKKITFSLSGADVIIQELKYIVLFEW